MFTLNFGPCRRRSHALQEIDKPDTEMDQLERAFEFFGFLNGGLGGNRVILNFLKAASVSWPERRTMTFLELRCGRGDLSASVVRWAHSRKINVQILAVDECPSVIELAKSHHGNISEITFDIRYLTDPRFLEAQQFDYVISSSVLHALDSADVIKALKTSNLLAKRGLVFSDWLRDMRAWMWMQALSRFWGDEIVIHDGLLGIRKGFTMTELEHLARSAGLDFVALRRHLGYRFSLAGERGLVLSPKMLSNPRFAGA